MISSAKDAHRRARRRDRAVAIDPPHQLRPPPGGPREQHTAAAGAAMRDVFLITEALVGMVGVTAWAFTLVLGGPDPKLYLPLLGPVVWGVPALVLLVHQALDEAASAYSGAAVAALLTEERAWPPAR